MTRVNLRHRSLPLLCRLHTTTSIPLLLPSLFRVFPSALRSRRHTTPTAGREKKRPRPGRHKAVELSLKCTFDGCTSKKVFTKQCDFDKHFRNHSRPVDCPFKEFGCKERFAQNKGLHRHLWVHHRAYALQHGIPSVEKRCSVCGEKARGDNLKRHMRTHE